MATGPAFDPERVAELYGQALELEAAARASFLDRAAAGEPELRAEVESLLASHDRAEGFLHELPAELLAALDDTAGEIAGQRVGPYRLLSELGRGGMGVVYLAARAEGGFEQQVALKRIDRAFVSPALAARFLRERQILARLEHPHIARLLDGGLAADGSPYFAMEWVRGEPLLGYCATHRLSLEARLALFDQACRAVAYAHAQLVVHRDLKPSNLLVGEDGNLKLLDFGIARLLDADSEASTALTRAGLQPLTPEYAAPEQRQGQPATTATDVYSLGLVLRELIGSPVPSGDLAAILAQALEEDPAARYSSAEALGEDLRRFRSGLPVRALPATFGYRARKFLGRHRLGLAASAAAALALVAGLVVSLWQARIAGRERDTAERARARAEQVQDFLESLFESADPATARGEEITARELLDRGAARIDSELSGQPQAQADLLNTLARVNMELGRYDEARRLGERGLAVARALPESQRAAVAQALNLLGNLDLHQGDAEAAEPRQREALALRREHFGAQSVEVAEALNDLAIVQQVRSMPAEAEATYRESLAIYLALGKEKDAATTWSNLSGLLHQSGDEAGAETAIREALRLWRRHLDPDHLLLAMGLGDLALVRAAQGELAEAEALNREALAIQRRVQGPQHPNVATRLNNLATVLLRRGDPTGAEPLLREALDIHRAMLGTEHPNIAIDLDHLALAITRQGRFSEALPIFRQSLAMRIKLQGKDHPTITRSLLRQAEALAQTGGVREALPLAEEALALLETRPGAPHPDLEKTRALCAKLRAELAAVAPGAAR